MRTGKLALRLATARCDREWIGVAVADIDAVAIRLVIAVLAFNLARFAALGGASGTGVARCRHFLFNAVSGQQIAHGIFFHLFPTAAFQAARQGHGAVAGTDQARNGQADRFEHAAHFAVTAFADHHAVPLVDAFAAAIGDLRKLRQAVFQLDAGQQLLAHALFQLAQGTHGVLAVDAVARVHQAVGQVTGSGEQQQAFRVEVEAANGQPFAGFHGRQAVKHGWTAVRVVVADDFAGRLVVHQHAWRLLADAALDQLAIDAHVVAWQDALADVGWLAIHGHAARDDQVFHVAARTETGFGQHLVQLRRVVVGRQVAAHGHFLHAAGAAFFAVERVGGDEREDRISITELARRSLAALALFTALAGILAGARHVVARTARQARTGHEVTFGIEHIGDRRGGLLGGRRCGNGFGRLRRFGARRLAQCAFRLHATHLARTTGRACFGRLVSDDFRRGFRFGGSGLGGGAGARRTRRRGGNRLGSGFRGVGDGFQGRLGAGFLDGWCSFSFSGGDGGFSN